MQIVPSPNVIRHEGASRSIDVGIEVTGRDRRDVASDVHDTLQSMVFPVEYHAEIVEGYDDDRSNRQLLLATVAATLIGILLLLQSTFGSWRLAAIVLVALPGALAGGAVAAVIDGHVLSIGTIAGFLGVFGLAARNSALFAQRCHQLEDADGGLAHKTHVVRAARDCLAPIATSAIATFAMLAPMLFLGGAAGFEVIHPMIVVMIGGLVTTTVFSVVVMPSLYGRFGSRSQASRERFDLYAELLAVEQQQAIPPERELQPVES